MALRVRPASPSDVDDIVALLREAFNAPPGASFTDPRLLHWKYFEPFGRDSLPRSYVLLQEDAVVAHCMASPLTLTVPRPDATDEEGARLSAVCFMDWVGKREVPGAGIILMKKLMANADVAIVAGGSDATRRIVPKLGYQMREKVRIFARVVRPVRQMRSRPSAGIWKDAARLVRNAIWSRTSLGPVGSEWQAHQVTAFAPMSQPTSSGHVEPERTPEYLNYWLRCPAAAVRGFDIYRGAECVGRFLLSTVAGQVRVAAMWLAAANQRDWETAYRLAVRAAADDPAACEIVCFASTPVACSALLACGFRERDMRPLFTSDPRRTLAGAPAMAWDAINDDAAYVFDPANPYRT